MSGSPLPPGLHLNRTKTEMICEDPAGSELLEVAPDLGKVNPEEAFLLGSPYVS